MKVSSWNKCGKSDSAAQSDMRGAVPPLPGPALPPVEIEPMFAGAVTVDVRIASSVSQNSPEFLCDPSVTGVIHQAESVSERFDRDTMGQIPHIGRFGISLP